MKQSRISAMEDVNHSSWSIRTLSRLAEAFDVALEVCFKSFSERIQDIERFILARVLAAGLPKIGDSSEVAAHVRRLTRFLTQFTHEPSPDGLSHVKQHAQELMRFTERVYRKGSGKHREFERWVTKLIAGATRFAVEAERQRKIDAIEAERQRQIDVIHRAADDVVQRIRADVGSFLQRIAAERERIRGLSEVVSEGQRDSLRRIEEDLLDAEQRAQLLVAA